MERARRPELPFPESLCHRCTASRMVRGRATTFLMCTALAQKYPPQPVLRCAEFRPQERERETPPRARE